MVTVKEYLQKLFNWVDQNLMQIPTKQEPQPFFSNALLEIDSFGKFANNQICPGCHKKEGFNIDSYERGNNGWELKVNCKHCKATNVVNTTGFRFEVRR